MELADLVSGGEILRITRWGQDVLHQPTTPVTVFDEALHIFLRNMFATMEAAQGVGLAATQVGDDRSIFIYHCPDADDELHTGVMINPTVMVPEGDLRQLTSDEEGCLSLPGAFATLARPSTALCRGLNHMGEPVEVSGTGMLARCLQHETDHLGGIVFGDRLSARSRKQLYADHEQTAYRYSEDWPISDKAEFDPSSGQD
ncbi:MAG: peptide deformylase [Propionibacteriaceae bacterium]|jgi:peptide deformylase|nr:peptide deformylase [Propionibacteriaceae bacterium]